MLRHGDIWRAIDRLAAKHRLSPSGLARRAGLDPTTFNKSKRINPAGKPRWPSTESLSKVLACTGDSLAGFLPLLGERSAGRRRIPVLGYAQAGAAGHFDDAGYPAGRGWDTVDVPDIGETNAYALKIAGDSMEPVYRRGDIIVVAPAAPLRRGDRVVVRTRAGEVMAKQLGRRSARRLELLSINAKHPDRVLAADEVEWIARILWVSQ